MPKQLSRRYLVTPEEYKKLLNPVSLFNSSNPYHIPHPNAKAAKETEDRMQNALFNPSTSETEKALVYASELTKFLQNFTDAVSVPKSQAILGTTPVTSTPNQNDSSSTSAAPTISSPTPVSTKTPPPSISSPSTPVSTKARSPKTKKPTKKSLLSTDESQKVSPKRQKKLRYSKEKILNEWKNTTEAKNVEDMLSKLEKNPDFQWNSLTGQAIYKGKTLNKGNISSLITDALSNQPTFTTRNTLTQFKKALKD
jgi:hypothetical protein